MEKTRYEQGSNPCTATNKINGLHLKTWGCRWVVAILVLSLAACSVGTIKPFLKDQAFQQENQPVRILRTIVLTDGSKSNDQIMGSIKKISSVMEEQVGINIHVVEFQPWVPESKKRDKILRSMAEYEKGHIDFDIIIFFTSASLLEYLGPVRWVGLIDDSFRRFIVLKSTGEWVLLHEIYHAFVLSKIHTRCILATGMNPFSFFCIWLTVGDREEVLKNKFRDFSIPLHIKGEDKIQ